MKTILAMLVSFLVAQSVGGYTVVPASSPVALASGSCTYHVDQGNHHYVVQPVPMNQGVVTFYDYYSASAHTPYVEAYASVLYLYRDLSINTPNNVYFVFHFNIDDAGSPDAQTDVNLTNIPTGAAVVVADDPGEFQLGPSHEGVFHYWLNTDGGVLGPLPTTTAWWMSANVQHYGPDPMTSQKWVDGDGTRLGLDLWGIIMIESVCNAPPVANAGGPYAGNEGSPITFDASGSSDPDGDSLTYTWDFTNDGVDDVTTTSPTVQHTYPDDFVGLAGLRVFDGGLSNSTTTRVRVSNVAPSAVFDSLSSPNMEGNAVALRYHSYEPGADRFDTFVDWGDGDVSHATSTMGPGTDFVEVNHTYGDDGSYPLVVTATDDDGGVSTLQGIVAVVDNAPPTVVVLSVPTVADEGAIVPLAVAAQDPGSDDLSFSVDFGNGDVQGATAYNDGVGPDPYPSPGGTYPFYAEASFTTRYVQDGNYTGTASVRDDDGGLAALNFSISVRNLPPTIIPFGPASAPEGSPGTIAANATDPGDDALTFLWEFELGPTVSDTQPAAGSPTNATSTASFLYGDDGSYRVRLTVTNEDGASAVYETTVEVPNRTPVIDVEYWRWGNFTLRVAGEKWHDVNATFYQDGAAIDSVSVTRFPGSPDEQAATTGTFNLSLSSRYTAKILYTPEDDPVNGQPNGANPVWVIVRGPGGQEIWIHHTFNVQHPGTYVWDVDLTPYVAQLAVTFTASASDPGSDDLAFAWDFGDGTTANATSFNDGLAADPPKSPWGTFPFTATDTVAHAFPGPGTYAVTLTVSDDDGGAATVELVLVIR